MTMTREDFREYVSAGLARHLTRITGAEWNLDIVDPPETGYLAAELQAGSGMRLRVHVRRSDGRLVVTGMGPEGFSLAKTWRRSFATDPETRWPVWDSLRIAREVKRHIIAAGYADDYLVASGRAAEHAAQEGKRANMMADAAELFGIDPPPTLADRQRNTEAHRLNLGRFVRGQGYAEPYGWHGDDAELMDITLSGIDKQTALAMLAVLASSQTVHASCCFTYGPDHHPRFSVTGCLYPGRADRQGGEQPSRERVYAFLTRSRGLDKVAVVMAMDEAKAKGAAVIEPDGAVLAVITWNHENCGEYTVEVPRD